MLALKPKDELGILFPFCEVIELNGFGRFVYGVMLMTSDEWSIRKHIL